LVRKRARVWRAGSNRAGAAGGASSSSSKANFDFDNGGEDGGGGEGGAVESDEEGNYGEDRGVLGAVDAREAGKSQGHADEMEYLLEGLGVGS
jgi:hypothetical protein